MAAADAAASEEVVIVTAERRAQPIEDEGSSVAVLGAEALERIGAQHTAEVLNRLPGFNYHRGSGVENLPAIRSPVLNGGAGAGSFLVLEDGVPVRAAPFANINQVYETVHGANAVHGVINVITPDAVNDGWRAEAEGGSFGRWRGEVLARGGGAMAGASALHEDGWRDQAGLNLQRLLLGWDGAAAAWRMRVRASASNLEQETAGFAIGPNAYDNSATARANLNPEAHRDRQVGRASIALARSFGGVDVIVTPFVRWIETDLLLHFFPSKALEETVQSGGGLQSSLAWELTPSVGLLAGIDVDLSTASLRETQSIATIGTFPQGVHYDYEVEAFTSAAYGQATWRPAPRWSATLGARGERIVYDYDNRAVDGGFGRFLRVPDRDDAFSALTARFNVVRRFDRGSAYVNFATGARPPQASDLYSLQTTQTPGEQGVEDVLSREAGVRIPLGGGQLSLVAYDMRKQGGAFRNANGLTIDDTRTRHRGVEAAFDAPLSDTLSLSGWLSYADHTYRFTSLADGIVYGARTESAPGWTGALYMLWRPTAATELELGWRHVGDYITDASGAHGYPGHDIFSLRGAWRVNEAVQVFGTVRNLTNTDYAERADFGFGNERYFPGEDRAFSLGLRVSR